MPPNPTFLPGEILPAGKLQDLGRRFLWTPVLEATTTNPDLGTGGTAVGDGVLLGGGIVVVRWNITFGSSATSAGSGTYLVGGMPYNLDSDWGDTVALPGGVFLVDASSSARRNWQVRSSTASPQRFVMTDQDNNAVTQSFPWGWADNDRIQGTATFLADDS